MIARTLLAARDGASLGKRLRAALTDPVTGVWSVGCVLVLLVLGIGAWSLWQAYDAERRHSVQTMANLAAAIGQQATAMARNGDNALATAAALSRVIPDEGFLDLKHRLLATLHRRGTMERISIFDINGRVVVDSLGPQPSALPYDPEDPALRMVPVNAEGDLYFSPPVRDRRNGGWLLLIRRPVIGSNGEALGTVEGITPIGNLADALDRYDPGPDGSVSLLLQGEDDRVRIVLVRTPRSDGQIGTSFRTTEGSRSEYSTGLTEIYFGPGFVDGIPRLFVTHPVGEYRLFVTVGTKWRHILDRWYERAPFIVASTAAGILFIVLLMVALAWQITRRMRMGQRLTLTLSELAERRRGIVEVQQSKIDALARMSGGIAHEFSNLLQPIATLSELGQSLPESAASEKAKTYFSRIGTAARQAIAIAGDFLTFSGSSQRRPIVSPLSTAVHEAVEMVRPVLGDVKITLEVKPETQAYFEPLGLSQILNNLMKNSLEAWQRAPELDRPLEILIRAGLDTARKQVKLSISDNGPGMSGPVRARVFEPFFTTKGASGGTGLGLSVVYGLVHGWNGEIRVDSVVGQGATFNIFLRVDGDPVRNESENDPEFRAA